MAQQRRGETAAVQKQNHLIIGLQMLTHAGNQRRGESRLQLLSFQIQHVLLRRTSVTRTLCQLQLAIFPLADIV